MLEPLSCPFCQTTLKRVSNNGDFFCPHCLAAVCIDGDTAILYQPESGQTSTIESRKLRSAP